MNHICEVCIILATDLRSWLNLQNRQTLKNRTPIISWQINNKKPEVKLVLKIYISKSFVPARLTTTVAKSISRISAFSHSSCI